MKTEYRRQASRHKVTVANSVCCILTPVFFFLNLHSVHADCVISEKLQIHRSRSFGDAKGRASAGCLRKWRTRLAPTAGSDPHLG